jgi:chlorobactene glucosyltransferase
MAWFYIWWLLLGIVALVWLTRHVVISRSIREQTRLSSSLCSHPIDDAPFISVLIAAKDEEQNIETAVRTFLDQDYRDFEMIVVNDRSVDRTGEILERIRVEQPDGRLKVIHVDALRDGWFGKCNAMDLGVAHAKGRWLCFADADCRQTSHSTLTVAMQYARAQDVAFLSILPRLENRSLWEKIIQPVCGAVMMNRFNPRFVNDPNHPAAYANGAFMLISRDCYESIGGHASVRTMMNEDMHLARLTKEQGHRLRIVENEDLYTVRMYSSLPEIWNGWSRIFYGCFGSFRRLRFAMMTLVGTNFVPYLSVLISVIVVPSRGWEAAGPGWRGVLVLSSLAVLLQQSVLVRFYRLSRTSPLLTPTFIIGAVVVTGILGNAMFKLGGRTATKWRGTTYRDDKVLAA